MTINIKQFQELDIRVGTVIKAEVPKWSHWVMKLTVDFGTHEYKVDPSIPPERLGQKSKMITVFAGIMHFFKTSDLEGRQFPFIVNMEPKKIGPEGDYSEGMLMAATALSKTPIVVEGEEIFEKPVLLSPLEKVPNGTKIS